MYAVKPASPRKKNYGPAVHRCVPVAHYAVKAIMRGEVKIRIDKSRLNHHLFKGCGDGGLTFLAPCNNDWNVDAATNNRNKVGKQYTVLAESERGPMVIEYKNIIATQFHISGEQKYASTAKMLHNFVKNLHSRLCVEGKIGISCEFLKNGDPNLKPSGGGERPFSAPVRRTSSQDGGGASSRRNPKQAWGGGKKQAAAGTTPPTSQPSTARTSATTKIDKHDVTMLAKEGYATPRFCNTKAAATPRGGVKLVSNQDDVETRVSSFRSEAVTDRSAGETGRSTLASGGAHTSRTDRSGAHTERSALTSNSNGEFSHRLLAMGGRLGLNMDFAKKFNEKAQAEAKARAEAEEEEDSDDDGDAMYFDDVSGIDSWNQGALEHGRENRPPPNGTALNLSNIHGSDGIAWGENIKVDSTPVVLESSKNIKDRTEKDEREASRAKGNIVRVKTPRTVNNRHYNNYSKFEEMQKEDGGKDWYIFNDGTPYVSSSERELAEENYHRRRGMEGKGGGGPGFHNVVGKRSAMRLPDKHGVVASGPYYGKVECSTQIDIVEGTYHHKERFVNQKEGGGGWRYAGDRQKPYWAGRIGRGKLGKSQAGEVNTEYR
jgi:hypothetical protein